MTDREIYRNAQRERTRARKKRDRLGRNQTEFWMLKREEGVWTMIIMWQSTHMQEQSLGL